VATFRHTIDIDATPEQVWAVLGDIGSVNRWIPGLAAVAVSGMSRVCAPSMMGTASTNRSRITRPRPLLPLPHRR
jgi:carbon monoxide dehydrogenase subunit G